MKIGGNGIGTGTSANPTAAPTPMVLVQYDGSLHAVPLSVSSGAVVYSYTDSSGSTTTVTVMAADEFAAGLTDTQKLIEASRKEGVTLFRYDLGVADLPVGTVTVTLAAGSIKNADVTSDAGTTAGASNEATTLSYTVTGVSAVIADPTPGAAVDIGVINGRNWIDVTIDPADDWVLDVASVTDLAPEFVLSGPGLGSIVLDPTRAPTLLTAGTPTAGQALTFRFWLIGQFADPVDTVELTFIARSWSVVDQFTGGDALTVSGDEITTGTTPGSVTIEFPGTPPGGAPASGELDPASLTDTGIDFVDQDTSAGAPGIQLVVSGGWVITLDETRAITRVGTTNSFVIPVIVEAGGAANLTFTANVATGATSWTTDEASGSQAEAPQPVTVPTQDRSYLDVTFSPSSGFDLDPASITGDEISIGGFGGSGVSLPAARRSTSGTNTWRFLLTGTFRVGVVEVEIHLGAFTDTSARGPPPADLSLVQTFTVTGATADLVHTVPATATEPETLIALDGAVIGVDAINGPHYLEVTFRPSSGFALDPATITGGELELRDAAGTLIALGAPIRVGLSTTYRYSFSTDLAVGVYSVTFVAGSFGDTGGLLNAEETETFTVTQPTVTLENPVKGQVIDVADFNARGYVDITFAEFHGGLVDGATITDSDAEITITADGVELEVLGSALLVSGTTYRTSSPVTRRAH